MIYKNLKPLEKYLVCPIEFNEYQGEFDSFFKQTGSNEAWDLGRDFFMENSGTALHFMEILDKETLFNPTNWLFDRFLHSFCNELGFTNVKEGKMLFEYSVHRATVEAHHKNDRNEIAKILEQLRQKLESLETEFLQ